LLQCTLSVCTHKFLQQAAVDDVSVGDLEEGEARDGARARRKALTACIEEELMPAAGLLRSKTTAAALRAAVTA
jgi:hypothetical protein